MVNAQGNQFTQQPRSKRTLVITLASIAAVVAAITAAAIAHHLRSKPDECAGAKEADACRFELSVTDQCEKTPDYEGCLEEAGYFDHLTPDAQNWVRAMRAGPLRGSRLTAAEIMIIGDPPGIYCGENGANKYADRAQFESLVINDHFDPFHARWWIAEARQRSCPQDLTDEDRRTLLITERPPNQQPQQVPPAPQPAPQPPERATVTVVPPVTPPPAMQGADSHGFLDSTGPQCIGSDAAALLLRTAQSRVLICRGPNGSLSYRGVRLSDGAGIDLSNVQSNSDGYTATNPADGTEYRATLKGLVITNGNQVIASEDALEAAFM